MGRRALGLGEAGQIEASPQHLVDGHWRRAPNAKSAIRWRARVYYRGQDGIRRELCAFAKTKRQSEQDLQAALQTAMQAGSGIWLPTTPLLLAGEEWLEQVARPGGLSSNSLGAYEYSWKRYVAAPGCPLRGLTLEQANHPQRLRAALQVVADQYGGATAKTTRSVLNNVLGEAVKNGALPGNAMLQVGTVRAKMAKRAKRDHERAFTREQRDLALKVAYDRCLDQDGETPLDPRTRRKRWATADLMCLMAGTGARIDEARRLRWEAVDLDTGAVILPGTKTELSLRRVDAPEWLQERLRARQERVGGGGLVVASPASPGATEKPWDQSNSASAIRQVLDLAGLTWAVPHTFRRTGASLLHKQGVPLARIADWLGHASTQTTMQDYLGRDMEGSKADLASLL